MNNSTLDKGRLKNFETGYVLDNIIKDNRKSFVAELKIKEVTYVYKEYRFYKRNNKQRFIRMVKRVISGDYAYRQFIYMTKFLEYGIPTTKPISVIKQNGKFGLVMQKENILRYSNAGDINHIIRILGLFHSIGYLHGDPDPNNFIITEQGDLLAVDFIPRKNILGKFGAYYELNKVFNKFDIKNHIIQKKQFMKIVNVVWKTKLNITSLWKLCYKRLSFL